MHTRLLFLGANAMAAFMDFGVGCLIAASAFKLFETNIAWPYLLIGGLLALIPDIDLIPTVIMGRSAAFDHRQTLFHRPLLVLPIATLIGSLLGGEIWAIVTFVCVVWHYLHDTNFTDTSYGIAWLWPFSSLYWSVWGSYMSQSDTSYHEWLENFWLKPSFLSMRELSIGLFSLIAAAYLSSVPVLYSTSSVLIILIGVSYIWIAERFLGHA